MTLHFERRAPVKTYPRGRRCVECAGIVSIYTPPQPITGDPLCNTHWCVPTGYCISGRGNVIKERSA